MLARFQAERHRTWGRCVLEGVVQENVSHAPEQVFVAGYPCVGVRQVCRKAEVANSGDLFPRLGNSLQHGGEINGLQLQRFPSQVGSGHRQRSEEHTSELQSPCNLVCRLLLEKKKKINHTPSSPRFLGLTIIDYYISIRY